MSVIYKVSLDTRHYSFECFDPRQAAALGALVTAIRVHCDQTGVSLAEFLKIYAAHIVTTPITIGAVYRDGQILESAENEQLETRGPNHRR